MFGLSTLRLVIYGICLVSVIAGALAIRWHYISLGEQKCQQSVNRAIQQQQAIADQNAEIYQTQQTKTRVEYRTRIKETTKYVPVNHACDLPAPALELLNNAINCISPSR